MPDAPICRPGLTARRYRICFLAILAIAGVWRLWLAAAMPCLSRDGAKYCWMAQTLEQRGPQALRLREFDQHPAYPFAVLVARHMLTVVGFEPAPLTWQRAGQSVAWICGLLVIALTGQLTRRLVELLEAPVDAKRAGLLAMSLATVLDLNAWLSADVMSEELYLVFFLGAMLAMLQSARLSMALAAGALAGLAYLTRPEALVLCFGMAATVLADVLRGSRQTQPTQNPFTNMAGVRRAARTAAAFAVAFACCVAPYCLWIGGLSPKAGKETTDQFRAAAPLAAPALAALLREDFSWYGAIGKSLKETLRAGCYIVPLIGGITLLRLRRDWSKAALAGWLTCLSVHFLLTVLLPYRHGYLDTRHTLVVVMLLLVPAGLGLAFVVQLGQQRGTPRAGWFLAAACILGPVYWATRVPNLKDAYIPRAAAALEQKEGPLAGKRLLAGSSPRRVAFYANLEFVPWPENDPTEDAKFAALHTRLTEWERPPEYFAIETGDGERAGNDRLIARLLADPALAGRLHEVVHEPGEKSVVLRIFTVGR